MEPQDPASIRIPTNLADEMQQSYMAYAMSVIIGRALPDIRDGLKPANRRVLYGMQQMGAAAGAALQEVREDRRRGDGQLPPARRRGDLRHPRPHGAGLQPARDPRRRPGELRQRGRRPARGHALHRGPPRPPRRGDDDRHRQGHRRLRADLRRQLHRADRPPHRLPEPARERRRRHRGRHGHQHPAPQPRRGRGRPELRPRQRGPDPGRAPRRRDGADQGAGLPHRRLHPRARRDPPGLPHRPRLGGHARQGGDRDRGRATRSPSSSPRSPTR